MVSGGVEDGEAKGEARGELLKLIELVRRKLQKDKTPDMIADELEEPLETVNLICTAVSKCDPETSATDIYNQLQSIN